uniref:Uncharacterized protein n=1 Tax=Arundo donax TaxID=35708 RepID=A0A0A8XNE4_ARUDO
MDLLRDTTGKKEVVVCYMNAPLPYTIEENYDGCFFDDDDDLAQVLQDQVGCHLGVYCSLFLNWLSVCSTSVCFCCYWKRD